ncbi:MAG: phosphohexose mutase [Betaproteobacteria bacterium]|nr:phosphohexose mutase [Betaproteobacteria bacterium]
MTTAIILAGGLGTRLRDAVPDLPKPMAPINGRPFLEHQLDYWIGQGIERFVLSVGYRHKAITAHFGAAYKQIPLDYAIEPSPLGTGGALLLAAERLSGEAAFLLLNGDTYFEVQLAALYGFHKRKKADCTFALFRAAKIDRYMGMETAGDGRIASLRSGSGEPGQLVNGGVYLVNPDALCIGGWKLGNKISLEDDILPAALAAGRRFYGLECSGTFIDIGVPEDYFRASGLLAARASSFGA